MRKSSFLFIALLSACTSQTPAPPAAPALPATCQTECVTPFGLKLGEAPGGVAAFSNCGSACVFEKPSLVNGTFAGIEWQCVEFARRWLIKQRGITFPSIDVAADLWAKVDAFERVGSKEKVPVRKIDNGAARPPAPGDLLIYAREYYATGHVAVVLSVDEKKGLVRVGEENFDNRRWPGDYAREIPFVRHGKKAWVLEPYLLGWISW